MVAKTELTVDEFIATRVQGEHRDLAQALRALIKRLAPASTELMNGYGIPAWKGRGIFAVLSPTKRDLTLAFSRGAEFEDIHALLVGVGKVSKNLKLRSMVDLDEAVLRYYLEQALRLDAD
jgi:hypothetical protein